MDRHEPRVARSLREERSGDRESRDANGFDRGSSRAPASVDSCSM
ncbi:hypothetical protein CRG98_048882, partial [Punica granatum]